MSAFAMPDWHVNTLSGDTSHVSLMLFQVPKFSVCKDKLSNDKCGLDCFYLVVCVSRM